MRKWDDDEKREDSKQERNEKLGRFMVAGSVSVLVVYLGTVFLELYLNQL